MGALSEGLNILEEEKEPVKKQKKIIQTKSRLSRRERLSKEYFV